MQVPEYAFGREQRSVLGEILAVHDQMLPVHVHLDVVEALAPERVDHVQRHADVAHQDLHRRLGVLVLEKDRHAAVLGVLRNLAHPVEESPPRGAVGRLERVVVAFDSRPDDEVRLHFGGEVDRLLGPA